MRKEEGKLAISRNLKLQCLCINAYKRLLVKKIKFFERLNIFGLFRVALIELRNFFFLILVEVNFFELKIFTLTFRITMNFIA